jgi:hypothetical protein
MPNAADKLIDSLASKLVTLGVPIRKEDNAARLRDFEQQLPKRLPQSFAAFLATYSFPSFDIAGISLFDWDSDSNAYATEAAAKSGSLSELLIPAGYVQIGRPDTGDFDAICFDLNLRKQKREYRIVRIGHEDILCNSRVWVSAELWPSFIGMVEHVLSSFESSLYYEPPLGGY